MENMKIAAEVRNSHPDRLIIVTADDIAERIEFVLARIADLPGMGMIDTRREHMVSSGVASQYSKKLELQFTQLDRIKEADRLADLYAVEMSEARQWLVDTYGEDIICADYVANGMCGPSPSGAK
jgi:hypothetical protein